MNYRTVRHHLKLLEGNGLVVRPLGGAYASPYELAPSVVFRFELVRQIRNDHGRARRRSARSVSTIEGWPGL